VNQHLDVDALADVLAGGHEPHLDGCDACRSRLAELSAALPAVTAALAALPDPVPPADLEQRLTRALEQARRGSGGDVLPLVRRRARWLPALSAVAAAAVLVTGGLLLAQRGGSTGTTQSATGSRTYAVNDSGTNYTAAPGSLAAALPALLTGQAERAAQDSAASPAPFAAGSKQVQTPTPGPVMGALTPPAVDALAPLRTTTGLARCLASLTDPGDTGLPLALDYAAFNGTPALVVVLPSSKPDKVDVFVVPAGCAQADGRVLFFTRLPKP
jgi:hypothetical protein